MLNFLVRLFFWREFEMLDSAWTCSLDELSERIEFSYYLACGEKVRKRPVKEVVLWNMRRLLWEILWMRIEESAKKKEK